MADKLGEGAGLAPSVAKNARHCDFEIVMLRVHLKHIDSEYTPRDHYTFDLKVDADNKPVSDMVFFDLWGEFNNYAN
jgi:hypothetical protein